MQLSNAGILKINNLAGTGNRLLQTDANGNVLPFAMGTATQVLYGNGVWGNLPAPPTFSNSTSCITNAPLWSIGGNNFTAAGSLTQASIGTCNNEEFVIKSHGNNRMWFKQDGTVSFGNNLGSTLNYKEYRFDGGALRLSGDNSFGGPMIVFDGGANANGDWGIEYQPTQFAKPGLNFWKPYPSPNTSNHQFFLADDGMIGVGTANPLSRFEVDAWSNDGITVRTIASKKAFSSINKNTNQETFSISADGKTKIGATGSTDTLLTVNGTLKTTNLSLLGTISLPNGLNTDSITAKSINIGTNANPFKIATSTAPNGAKVASIGIIGPIVFPPSTCLAPVASTDLFTQQRFVIQTPNTITSTNLLDFRNDGTHGYIDFGFDNRTYLPKVIFDANNDPIVNTNATPAPVLKINGSCYGDVEIAHGGGVTSAGRLLEVGYPTRSYNVSANIKGSGVGTGLKITTSGYPDNITSLPTNYNTQLFVNRNRTHALSVFNTLNNANGDELFTVFGNGKVAIGDNYVPADYHLAVKGKVLAEEVVVLLRANWPDYVFYKNYQLKPLSEVEKYINEHKHLQNIPTAKDIETNGVPLGTIVTQQMEKIEELTLYLIEQQKQIEELKKQMNTIKK